MKGTSTVNSYISHIRTAVEKADLEEGLRQSIMSKLGSLQQEVDRNRTRVSAAMDIFAELTQGISAGAKNLEPAVKLVERVVGSLKNLGRKEREELKQLPAPDTLGLPDPKKAHSE